MDDRPRLIEMAFPLKQASLDSVHEKNVRHGHISTLHIWPARRPLAACRAALITTLLPDPGTETEHRALLHRLAGRVVTRHTSKRVGGRDIPVLKEETEGGILHWGRENGPDLEFFREEIKRAFGGRAPRVLDPFAGGGAIPLEAMRLGCEVTAIDINPVAWFILKCTLEYPQRLAGQTRPLPSFALTLIPSPQGRGRQRVKSTPLPLGEGSGVRATPLPLWHDGRAAVPKELLARARELRKVQTTAEALLWECLRDRQLLGAKFRRQHVVGSYIADFYCHEARLIVEVEGGVHRNQTLEDATRQRHLEELGYQVLRFSNEGVLNQTESVLEAIAQRLAPLPLGESRVREGTLADHVRAWGHWVLERAKNDLECFYPTIDGKPTVAYLWARTVTCKNCRATLPLLKTLWLCRKDNKRFRLELRPRADKTGVDFDVVAEPVVGGNAAQRRAHDGRVGQGTMSRSGAWCPVCGGPNTVAMTMDDIKADMKAQHAKGQVGAQMTAVVVDGPRGKEYRLPAEEELAVTRDAAGHVDEVFEEVPFGLPTEPILEDAKRNTWCIAYGVDQWHKVFTPRQLVALGTFVRHTRAAREAMHTEGYPPEWVEAVSAYLACVFDRMLDFNSLEVSWITSVEAIGHTFVRYALPITWDYSESAMINYVRGGWRMCMDAALESLTTINQVAGPDNLVPKVECRSVLGIDNLGPIDVVVTDPPYYDAIGYSVLMDFFYVWSRRTLQGLTPGIDAAFHEPVAPKWNHEKNDGELIDDASRFGDDAAKSKVAYEDGMFRAFQVCQNALVSDGRMVVVFANKQPGAWERLAASIIKAGFAVDGSWPVQTEQVARIRAQGSAALSSSVWLVCRKRPETARPGWDTQVLEDMRSRIHDRLRTFWDAGIRGPDFVWAATGPALEAYSKHPVVKKADEPNATLEVREFLQHVRRIVVDYVVGRVLTLTPGPTGRGEGVREETHIDLDNLTIYYLLHRHDFGLEEAPVGASILYAQSCNLRDRDLADRYDLLAYGKGRAAVEEEMEDEETEEEPSPWSDDLPSPSGRGTEGEGQPTSGSTVKLKRWEQRRRKGLGMPSGGRPASLIDQIHHIMHLWKGGDVQKVDGYLEDQGLRRNPVFPRVLQALIELARKDNQPDEVSLSESIMNYITSRGMHPQMRLEL